MKKFVSAYGDTLRRNFVLTILGLFALTVLSRVVYLQVYNKDFLVKQGNSRFVRTKNEPALRGTITDRNNIPLAVSTPVSSIWVNPKEILNPVKRQGSEAPTNPVAELANAIGMPVTTLQAKLDKKKNATFVYLQRGLEPDFVQRVIAKKIPGVYSQREYRRFYPSADVASQIIGYNNIDDVGQEGIELLYNDWLAGTPGSSEVIRDVSGRVVDILQEITPPMQGQPLRLTIDKRLQYLTYMALLETIEEFSPKSATAVVLDAKTSEVLSMVSLPSGNPNNGKERKQTLVKNRAITDTFEPGSVMKPFAIAAALEAGVVSPGTPIKTSPGYYAVSRHVVRDVHDYGRLSVAGVIKKSSNVGTCKIALKMPKAKLLAMYEALGLGEKSQIGFPGEQAGVLRDLTKMSDFDYCTNSYGYGVATTALQVAQSYAVLANDGLKIPATLVKRDALPPAVRLMSARTAKQVRRMLKSAVGEEGTGSKATQGDYMGDYSVGGKTGTAHKVIRGKYAKDKYRSVFAGMAPLSDPRIVMVVVVDEPKGKKYYGGLVAAPVFAKVVGKTLRMLGVSPDQKPPKDKDKVIYVTQKKVPKPKKTVSKKKAPKKDKPKIQLLSTEDLDGKPKNHKKVSYQKP